MPNVNIRPDLYARLQTRADAEHSPITHVVNNALRLFLAAQSDHKPKVQPTLPEAPKPKAQLTPEELEQIREDWK